MALELLEQYVQHRSVHNDVHVKRDVVWRKQCWKSNVIH